MITSDAFEGDACFTEILTAKHKTCATKCEKKIALRCAVITAQKMRPHLLKKSLMENFIFFYTNISSDSIINANKYVKRNKTM